MMDVWTLQWSTFPWTCFVSLHVNFSHEVTTGLLFVLSPVGEWRPARIPEQSRLFSQWVFCLSAVTGGAEHQAAVLHLPLAHLVAVAGVPPAGRHPHLGLSVLGPGPVPLPHRGLLRHAHVRCCLSRCNSLFVSPIIMSDGLSCRLLSKDSSETISWPETSRSIWGCCRYDSDSV